MTMFSRVLGFARETLMAAALGTGPMADAFYAAFRFPNLFRRLFAEGAFNAAFVPLFAKEIFGGDARLYGLLMGTAGCGALGGAVLLALRSDTAGLGALVGRMAPLVGLALAVFALSPSLWLSVPALLVLGFAILLCVAGSNTLIQTAVDNDYRGRVMALFTMAFLGLAPLGSFAVGSLAHAFGVRATLVACGLASCAAGLAYRRGQRARAG